jgi:predicted RNA-binding protein associated with RNAse of E/G family
MDLPALPSILEIKRTLTGQRKEFRCRLVEREADRAVVLFISSSTYQVATLTLPPGTITLGHFWSGRDYNVYHWLDPAGATLAHYFNLAADTTFDDTTLSWTDLAIDLLVLPGAPAQVLDEDELPADLPPSLQSRIEAARNTVLRQQAGVVAELEARADALWPRLFGKGRP